MSLHDDLERDDAILDPDEADGPIEEWTLDEFDRFADLRGTRGAWAAADELDF
jgi:hypothetical protein